MNPLVMSNNGHSVLKVEPNQVDNIRDDLERILSRSVPYIESYESISDLIDAMKTNPRPWQLFIIVRGDDIIGAFFTTINRAGKERIMQYEILAGIDAQEWIWPMVEEFEAYMAEIYDVTQSRIIGRKGWERFLRKRGYRASHFITTRKIIKKQESNDRLTYPPRLVSG